jgi:hypothetical protein
VQKVSGREVTTTAGAADSPLPAEIQEVLGQLVGAAREGLLALSVGAGLALVHELMELEVQALAGPKSKHDPDRMAKRHGYEQGSVTLGGRRVPVRRPRVKSIEDERELPRPSGSNGTGTYAKGPPLRAGATCFWRRVGLPPPVRWSPAFDVPGASLDLLCQTSGS